MAQAIALLGTANASDTDSATYTRVVTPVDNSLLVAVSCARDTVALAAPTVTDTGGLTWTQRGTMAVNGGTIRIAVDTAPVVASPGSDTVTWTYGATADGCSRAVLSLTGHNTGAPLVGSVVTSNGTSTGPNVGTVASLSSPGNLQLLVVGHQRAVADATAEAGWTKLVDVAGATPAEGLAVFARAASEDTTPTATLGSSVIWGAMYFEFAEAVAASGGLPLLSFTRDL